MGWAEGAAVTALQSSFLAGLSSSLTGVAPESIPQNTCGIQLLSISESVSRESGLRLNEGGLLSHLQFEYLRNR